MTIPGWYSRETAQMEGAHQAGAPGDVDVLLPPEVDAGGRSNATTVGPAVDFSVGIAFGDAGSGLAESRDGVQLWSAIYIGVLVLGGFIAMVEAARPGGAPTLVDDLVLGPVTVGGHELGPVLVASVPRPVSVIGSFALVLGPLLFSMVFHGALRQVDGLGTGSADFLRPRGLLSFLVIAALGAVLGAFLWTWVHPGAAAGVVLGVAFAPWYAIDRGMNPLTAILASVLTVLIAPLRLTLALLVLPIVVVGGFLMESFRALSTPSRLDGACGGTVAAVLYFASAFRMLSSELGRRIPLPEAGAYLR